MTIPNLSYGSSTSILESPISSQGAVLIGYNSSTSQLSIAQNTAFTSGQIINSKFYTLGTNFSPSVIVPTQGAASAYGYNPAALFWTINYTPSAPTSVVLLSAALCCSYNASTAQQVGIAVYCYSSNVAGSLPLEGSPAFSLFGVSPTTSQVISTYSALATYNNSSSSPINIYLCGYVLGASASQLIYSSSSTSTSFAGYLASTAKIQETFV
jgi:hypothetical protein